MDFFRVGKRMELRYSGYNVGHETKLVGVLQFTARAFNGNRRFSVEGDGTNLQASMKSQVKGLPPTRAINMALLTNSRGERRVSGGAS